MYGDEFFTSSLTNANHNPSKTICKALFIKIIVFFIKKVIDNSKIGRNLGFVAGG